MFAALSEESTANQESLRKEKAEAIAHAKFQVSLDEMERQEREDQDRAYL